MSNTRDHTEVETIVKFAGLDSQDPEKRIDAPVGAQAPVHEVEATPQVAATA